jgi:F-type H+-transporting ATPase subunit alpha
MRSDEIISLIEKELRSYQCKIETDEIGYVVQIGDGIANVYGLENAMVGEMLFFDNEVYGLVFNLERTQ